VAEAVATREEYFVCECYYEEEEEEEVTKASPLPTPASMTRRLNVCDHHMLLSYYSQMIHSDQPPIYSRTY